MSKVIGVGFHKTGTTSLGTAFRALGLRSTGWLRESASLYKRGHSEALLDIAVDFDGFEDIPWFLLYPKLVERFPGSKLVLTKRKNMDVWFNSLVKHVGRREPHPFMVIELLYGIEDVANNKDRVIARHEQHIADVRSFSAAQNVPLLEVCWEDGDGWQELCGFLACEVPDKPFPHSNAAPSGKGKLKKRVKRVLRL